MSGFSLPIKIIDEKFEENIDENKFEEKTFTKLIFRKLRINEENYDIKYDDLNNIYITGQNIFCNIYKGSDGIRRIHAEIIMV